MPIESKYLPARKINNIIITTKAFCYGFFLGLSSGYYKEYAIKRKGVQKNKMETEY
jgi:hypothetical protein